MASAFLLLTRRKQEMCNKINAHNFIFKEKTTGANCQEVGDEIECCTKCERENVKSGSGLRGDHNEYIGSYNNTHHIFNCRRCSDYENSIIHACGDSWKVSQISETRYKISGTCYICGGEAVHYHDKDSIETCPYCDEVVCFHENYTLSLVDFFIGDCVTPSYQGYTCDDCGSTWREYGTVNSSNHKSESSWDEVSPTGTAYCDGSYSDDYQDGYTAGWYCSACGEGEGGETITNTSFEHVGNQSACVIPVDPTCVRPGTTAGLYCVTCDTTLEEPEEIPALDHDYQSHYYNATCTANGYWEETCSRCNYANTSENPDDPATGHDMKNCGDCGAEWCNNCEQACEHYTGW